MSNPIHDQAIHADRLSKRFGRKRALHDLSLALPRGGVHAVVGSNGAGKSTLFRVLLGITAPSAGRSFVLGCDSRALTPERRGRVGFVGEEHTLPGWMTVARLKAMHRDLYPRWHEPTYAAVIGHFQVLAEQRVAELSRGERAGLNLALALAHSPELLFLDEPTLGLDVVAKQAFLESLLSFAGRRDDCTIVDCSHQMDEIERVADRLLILERGALRTMSALDEFCARVSGWTAYGLTAPLDPLVVPGLLTSRRIDDLTEVVVLDRDDGLERRLEALGGRDVAKVPLGFDRAVNAYLTRHHATPAN